jgi:hypothetical protein
MLQLQTQQSLAKINIKHARSKKWIGAFSQSSPLDKYEHPYI